MKISTKSQYGLLAMIYLANNKNKVSSLKEISKKEGVPFDYLEKIISRLEKANLLKSKRGVQGGYFLARPARKIKMAEIINVLEEKIILTKCLRPFCPKEKKCLARKFWLKLNKSINLFLNSITLADLIKK